MRAVFITNRKRPIPLDRLPANLEIREAGRASEALAIAREEVAAGTDRIVVAGGDGSVWTILPALAGTDCTLGLIPRGTGNDLAGSLGIPHDPRKAMKIALEGRSRQIDLIRVSAGPLEDYVAVGAGASAAVRVAARLDVWRRRCPRFTRALGKWGFVFTALAEVSAPKLQALRISWTAGDGTEGEWEGVPLVVLLFAAERIGGGFPAPRLEGRPRDTLRVVLLRDPGSLLQRLWRIIEVRAGRLDREGITSFAAKEVRMEADEPFALTFDGEQRKRRDPVFRPVPGGLRIAAP